MKYISLILLVFLLLASCRKDRSCICTRNNTNQTKDTYLLSVSKKADAEADCQDYYDTYSDYYSSCELD